MSRIRPFKAAEAWGRAGPEPGSDCARLASAPRRAGPASGARRAVILVVCDLDGTLAPIVSRPDRARVPARTIRLLERAAHAPGIQVAVVSARPLREMRRLLPVRRVLLVGQYGLEGTPAPPAARRERFRKRCRRLVLRLRRAADAVPGAQVEAKGLTAAVHDRAVAPRRRPALRRFLRRIEAGAARREGFVAIPGRRVVDFVPRGFDKGRVVKRLRAALRPAVVFYFGDSAGDDSAFAALNERDFPVRIGRGATRARYRVATPMGVTRFLETVARSRSNASSHKEVASCR
ncbi:MAG: trehalose-phosphatase [Candidatus Latescibacteria bacterium]|nr:trehalose-phosphatase [Candidatus Latescibacterota bacterium]